MEIEGNGGKTANARGYNAFQDFKLLPANSHCSGNHECTLQVHENLFPYTMLKLVIILQGSSLTPALYEEAAFSFE